MNTNVANRIPVTGVFLCAMLMLVAWSSRAQTEDCEQTLGRAVEAFHAGHFYAIPGIVDPCLSQFTREQRQRVYLLLTQAYLLLDDPIAARQSYLEILHANPEFLPDTAIHPMDVIYLGKRFTASPVISWFAKSGAILSIPRIIHPINAFGEMTTEGYVFKAGYQFAGGVDFSIAEKVDLRAELHYSFQAYRHETRDFFVLDQKIVDESQNWAALPITAIYSDDRGKYRPYGYVGYSLNYLLASRMEITLINNKPGSNDSGDREISTETSPALNTRFQRNIFNQSMIVGGGIKIKLGLDFIFVDARYAFGMRNIISGANLYGNYDFDPASPEFVTSVESSMGFAHVDDFFRMDNISVSVGFLRPLYKPRELKRARTRSVMRQMEQR